MLVGLIGSGFGQMPPNIACSRPARSIFLKGFGKFVSYWLTLAGGWNMAFGRLIQ
ncbi:MAG: hypothetical protein M5U34_04400 [Chloroflexi bacterium]|nr:hypothetical protein [Chloroflexota bacterium]